MEPAPMEWLRLDPRSMLTQPVAVLRNAALPVLAALFGIGTAGGLSLLLIPAGLVVAVAIGLVPWLTTTYRVTPTHLEVRRGLLQRSTVTARLDRIRSVDLEANPLHRVLGLTTVAVGTGVDDGQIDLDALAVGAAERLRSALLHGGTGEAPAAPTTVEIARLDWSWVRFAPLNVANLAIVAVAAGAVVGQLSDVFGSVIDPEEGQGAWEWAQRVGVPLLVVGVIFAVLVLWIPLSCVGYAVRWFGLTVTRETTESGTTIRRVHGALTQRATTVEEAKVRGATLTTPLLVGVAGGTQLSLLTTGLEDNEPDVLPAAPRGVAERVAADVLVEADAMTAALTGHGARTRRRYQLRAQLPAWLLTLVSVAATVALRLADFGAPVWFPVVVYVVVSSLAAAEAELRWRRLGHALTDRYLVVRTGALRTRRVALESDGIVGWRLRQSFFDRRRGLAQLIATTAAGPEQVTIPDVPLETAIELAARATPKIVSHRLARP
ncbi:PH domain-containing protein [Nocardioides sp.]|uniref:PH domain-containing protein n=1 Tax=Nocardioides sp. TaxID=35761 RepID=UPI0039E438A1